MILDIALDSHSLVRFNCVFLQPAEMNYRIRFVFQSNLPAMWGDRCMIVIILIVPSVTFLIFHESSFMPMLYIVQFLSQNMLYPAVMIHSGMLCCSYYVFIVFHLASATDGCVMAVCVFHHCSVAGHNRCVASGGSDALSAGADCIRCPLCLRSVCNPAPLR